MPEICRFWNIIIRMYMNEHNPPHFHVIFNDFEAVININTLELEDGDLPKKQLKKVLKWASIHQEELLDNWKRLRQGGEAQRIVPLNDDEE